ncbi:MAG: histidine phosphatase family protein [Anaerolineales bacterium]|uniref:histidine phosphatase family protein n=1 Tax=Candidatus Villigracilis proximus TaxID=3140683 RepID=UPI003136C6A6|nr:histidine phosphatase family protein [Anaerolineales bacterium]
MNQTGQTQAAQIAKRLSTETIHAIYTSDLSRATNTAQAIADFHQLEIKKDSRLRALSFGD